MPIQKESKAPLGPEAKGEQNGDEVTCYSSETGVWESVVSSPSGVRGAENGFIVI